MLLSRCLPRADFLDQQERIAWAMVWWSIRRLYPWPKRRPIWRNYRLQLYRLAGVAAYDATLLVPAMDEFIGDHIRFRNGVVPKNAVDFEQRLRGVTT